MRRRRRVGIIGVRRIKEKNTPKRITTQNKEIRRKKRLNRS